MVIRKADSKDLDSIYLMGYDVWSDGNTEAEYLNECRSSLKYKRGTWYVLEQNSALLSSLIIYEFKANAFGIGSIATPERWRELGYASYLISNVIKLLGDQSLPAQVFLYSDINPEFYERFGFQKLPMVAQRYKTTTCMARGAELGDFASVDQSPEYF